MGAYIFTDMLVWQIYMKLTESVISDSVVISLF